MTLYSRETADAFHLSTVPFDTTMQPSQSNHPIHCVNTPTNSDSIPYDLRYSHPKREMSEPTCQRKRQRTSDSFHSSSPSSSYPSDISSDTEDVTASNSPTSASPSPVFLRIRVPPNMRRKSRRPCSGSIPVLEEAMPALRITEEGVGRMSDDGR
ncbi:uncharacterized protein EI90DRAFT_3041037 [Cantharellus anzutake]|uniref:uncharacterized protein n=1 Tax=Cantharellus anzutake TaxID=1750568 RepID=UPI001903965C|nr:uncharacterized protein EI90DRAFT_3041037 [Cantharellus anzutake]KAF8337922.1 hypothetical protein EI90DRAFT_3041037 [Cantharellus anzutake]